MPFQDLASSHPTAAEKTQLASLHGQYVAIIGQYLRNLSDEERSTYPSLSDNEKLFVSKVLDYHESQPGRQSPDVDWPEYERDHETRTYLTTEAMKLMALAQAMLETCRLHDHDNLFNAKVDYFYSIYKDRTERGVGYDSKVEELKQFFKRVGRSTLSDGTDSI